MFVQLESSGDVDIQMLGGKRTVAFCVAAHRGRFTSHRTITVMPRRARCYVTLGDRV